jgi:hypothetical protein
MVFGQTGWYGWTRERERGMGGLLFIIHDSIHGRLLHYVEVMKQKFYK